jgi:hypothetical protein
VYTTSPSAAAITVSPSLPPSLMPLSSALLSENRPITLPRAGQAQTIGASGSTAAGGGIDGVGGGAVSARAMRGGGVAVAGGGVTAAVDGAGAVF